MYLQHRFGRLLAAGSIWHTRQHLNPNISPMAIVRVQAAVFQTSAEPKQIAPRVLVQRWTVLCYSHKQPCYTEKQVKLYALSLP